MNWSSCGSHIYLAWSKLPGWRTSLDTIQSSSCPPMNNFLRRVIYSSAPQWALKEPLPHFWQQVISSPSERSVWCFVPLLAADIKKQIATCLLWQAVKSFVKLLPRSCSSQQHWGLCLCHQWLRSLSQLSLFFFISASRQRWATSLKR